MSPNTLQTRWRLPSACLVLLVACQAEDRLAPPAPPSGPPAGIASHAFYLDIDVMQGLVRVVPPSAVKAASGSEVALSLAGGEVVGLTTSNFFRSNIGQFVANKRTITFDLTLTNKLSVTDLVTPTFPLPPNGTQGILAFPYTVAAYGVQGGKATPNGDWNGDGSAGSGKPFNFFNDFGTCGTAVTSDCYRWELFPSPLSPGQSTPAQKVGFTVDKNVTNVGVYLVVAADLLDHPPTPQPGLGALTGTVNSPSLGGLAGVTLTLSPGGQTAVTDGLGKYLLTALPVGPFTATVSGLPAGCTAPAGASVAITSGGVATANFSASCQATTGSISGTATSPELGPFAATTVQLLQAPALTLVTQTTTNAAGGFSFTGVVPGSYLVQVIGLQPPCPATGGPVSLSVAAGATSTATLSVPCVATGNGSIVGTVTSPQLGPLVTAISATSNGVTASATSNATTGGYGPISIAAGQVTVGLTTVPSGCTMPQAQTVSVTPGATATVDFAVTCSGGTGNGAIVGTATSPEVGPLASATVQLLQVPALTLVTQTTTDAAGGFSFTGVVPGSYLVQVIGLQPPCPATGGPVSLSVAAGATATAILSVSCTGPGGSNGSIVGTVTSPQLGPLAVQVSATSGGAASSDSTDPVTGAYGPISVAAGQVTVGLITLPSGCTLPSTQTVSLTAGASVTVDFSVDCPVGSMLTGQVTSATIGALGGVTVSLANPVVSATTVTDGAGNYSFPRSLCGIGCAIDPQVSITLTRGLPPFCATPAPVGATIPTTGVAVVPIVVDCTFGAVTGAVTVVGTLPPGATTITLTFSDPRAPVLNTTANAAGRYTFTAVPTEVAVITVVAAPGCSSNPVNITVPVSSTLQQDLTVSCP